MACKLLLLLPSTMRTSGMPTISFVVHTLLLEYRSTTSMHSVSLALAIIPTPWETSSTFVGMIRHWNFNIVAGRFGGHYAGSQRWLVIVSGWWSDVTFSLFVGTNYVHFQSVVSTRIRNEKSDIWHCIRFCLVWMTSQDGPQWPMHEKDWLFVHQELNRCYNSLFSHKKYKTKVSAAADNPPGMAPLNIMESNLPLPRDNKILHTSIEMSGKQEATFDEMSASTGSPQKSLENMSSQISLKTLGTMYHKELNEAPTQPHRRYQRRNSATASMLFPSVSTASSEKGRSNPCTTSVPLNLSFSHQHLTPREALEKAREMMGNVQDIAFATRVKDGSSLKRSSAAEACDGDEEQGRLKKRSKPTVSTQPWLIESYRITTPLYRCSRPCLILQWRTVGLYTAIYMYK